MTRKHNRLSFRLPLVGEAAAEGPVAIAALLIISLVVLIL